MSILKELAERVDGCPASISVIRTQWEQKLPMHKHEKGQLLLVTDGMANLRTKEKDLYVPLNHYIWMPKKYAHNLMFNSRNLHIINIYFPDHEEADHHFYDDLGIYPVSSLLSELLKFCSQWNGDFLPGSWEYEYLLTLKHLLPREDLKKFSIQLPVTDHPRLNEMLTFIRENLESPLTLEYMSMRFAMSVRSFTRFFSNELQVSFVQYLKMIRIIRAMELMQETDLSMSEIAYQIGYSNISAFSNMFQQLTNMRPTAFKLMSSK
ncbi:helix-turn-helix domain-containing protein [Chryseobacterium pennipullorum]|uniref:AraC family transcriptional regulator n=1 Tax=Chryseobacterium pennipullorum TaxID=2258963 RepID=A0A3D9B2N2_9FLAO|nr:AraC family transcriptional regulator [Chryseobacterium pennipullorum]REC47496.1 AraC family transcriptional regulator [Chryseobacterium pennipullorum]